MPSVDTETLAMLFGDEMPRMDALRQSSGDVSETGKALEGPGGPFDDLILAQIEDPASGEVGPARLSPGEFVIKAPAVSFLGDGDAELGSAYLDLLQNSPDALKEVKSVLDKYLQD